MKIFSLVACVAVVLTLNGAAYAADNVSFADVLAVPTRAADATVNYGDDQFQFAQLWLPSSNSKASIVLIHGGCWLNQFDIGYTAGLSTALAEEGYTVWSLEYRRTGDEGGGWPGTFEDIVAGINALEEVDSVDTTRLAILGHSAGGHLALLAGARSELLTVQPDLVVGLAAISDVVSYAAGSSTCEAATPLFMGGDVVARGQAYYEANPVNHGIHENTVLLQGDIDEIVPLAQATLEGAKTVISPGAGHFDWSHPGTAAFQQLLELLDDNF